MLNLSKVDIFGNETGTINTANCYIVHKPGYYSIPLIYGNAIKNGKPNPESYTNQKPGNYFFTDYVDYRGVRIQSPEIETEISKIEVLWKSDGIEIKSLSYNDHEIFFRLKCNKKRKIGENALIAIYNEDNTIIWSWHIWYYEGDLNPIYLGRPIKKTTKNYQIAILPVNLGWNGEIGTYYQWGRKDPFRGDIEKIIVRKSKPNISECIRQPNIIYEKLNYEGCVNLWDARCENIEDVYNQTPNKSRRTIKTIYDPCPVGLKVPGCDIFQILVASGVVKWGNGWYFRGGRSCGPDGVFFPASGYRDRANGGLGNVSGGGLYWTSASSSSVSAYSLAFYSGNVNPVDRDSRGNGFSIRPFVE